MKFVFLLSVLFCLSNYCHAKESVVSVVLSSDMGFYKEVESGFNSFFSEKGLAVHINEHNLVGQEDKAVFSTISSENPDLIFAVGEAGLKSAKQLTSGIPIVFSMVVD